MKDQGLLWVPKDIWCAREYSKVMSQASNVIGLLQEQEAF